MALDIFFTEDIRNALLAANEASSSTARVCAAVDGDQATSWAYLEGYRAALTTVALAFGLPSDIVGGGDAPPDDVDVLELASTPIDVEWRERR